jgi:hypothetical protein
MDCSDEPDEGEESPPAISIRGDQTCIRLSSPLNMLLFTFKMRVRTRRGIAPDQWSVYRSLDEAMVLTHRSPCSIENREPAGTMLMIEALRAHNGRQNS